MNVINAFLELRRELHKANIDPDFISFTVDDKEGKLSERLRWELNQIGVYNDLRDGSSIFIMGFEVKNGKAE